MLRKKEKEMKARDFEEELKNLYGYDRFDEYTKNKIIAHLFGSWEDPSGSEFKVVYRYDPDINTSPIQRFNLLWVYPVWLLIAPFKWIITGTTGVTKDSKVGKILIKLLGNY